MPRKATPLEQVIANLDGIDPLLFDQDEQAQIDAVLFGTDDDVEMTMPPDEIATIAHRLQQRAVMVRAMLFNLNTIMPLESSDSGGLL